MMNKEQILNVVKSEKFNAVFLKVANEYFEEHGIPSDKEEIKKILEGLKNSMVVYGMVISSMDEVYNELRG